MIVIQTQAYLMIEQYDLRNGSKRKLYPLKYRKMKDTFTPPKSLVRYPKATIIILFISFFVMDYFTNIGLWGKILGIIVM